MKTHKLLQRQLEKTRVNRETRPESDEQWLEFISRVNQTYIEADQERYMNERAMEIFSREMMGLNEMLEDAHRIAGLGYWSFNGKENHIFWSKETHELFNIKPTELSTTYQSFIDRIHEKDKDELVLKIDKALHEQVNYECDFRILDSDGNYRWFQTIGQCGEDDKQITGIMVDIHKKKESEEKIKELNNTIVTTAHRAGMVEVATSILHNIGNVLNSSNVSITLLKKGASQPYQERLLKIAEMLNLHTDDMIDFLIKRS